MQVNLQKDKFITPVTEEVWCRRVELPKIPSVVGCKDLREDGWHSDGRRG